LCGEKAEGNGREAAAEEQEEKAEKAGFRCTYRQLISTSKIRQG
jgi:hypothetical protein